MWNSKYQKIYDDTICIYYLLFISYIGNSNSRNSNSILLYVFLLSDPWWWLTYIVWQPGLKVYNLSNQKVKQAKGAWVFVPKGFKVS